MADERLDNIVNKLEEEREQRLQEALERDKERMPLTPLRWAYWVGTLMADPESTNQMGTTSDVVLTLTDRLKIGESVDILKGFEQLDMFGVIEARGMPCIVATYLSDESEQLLRENENIVFIGRHLSDLTSAETRDLIPWGYKTRLTQRLYTAARDSQPHLPKD